MKHDYRKTISIAFALSFLILMPVLAAAQLPVTGPSSWSQVFSGITQYVFQLGMAVAVIVIISSGVMFMTAGGNEDRVTRAKTTFFWALVGLAICLLGSGLVYVILDVMGGKNIGVGTNVNNIVSPTYTTGQGSQSFPASQGSQTSQSSRPQTPNQILALEDKKFDNLPAGTEFVDAINPLGLKKTYLTNNNIYIDEALPELERQRLQGIIGEVRADFPASVEDKISGGTVVILDREEYTAYVEAFIDRRVENGNETVEQALSSKATYLNEANGFYDINNNSIILSYDAVKDTHLLKGSLYHEYGHLLDDNYTYSYGDQWSAYNKQALGYNQLSHYTPPEVPYGATSGNEGFVTPYAMTNQSEHFAETVSKYYVARGDAGLISSDQNDQKIIQQGFDFLKAQGFVK